MKTQQGLIIEKGGGGGRGGRVKLFSTLGTLCFSNPILQAPIRPAGATVLSPIRINVASVTVSHANEGG